MSRDHILHKVRTAIGRGTSQPREEPPPVLLRVPEANPEQRIEAFRQAIEKLSGQTYIATSAEDALNHITSLISGRRAVASNNPFLQELGVTRLDGIESGITDTGELRKACAEADIGITSADYALADTGSLVMLSSKNESRLISLLPPTHIAVVSRQRLLTGLDELFTVIPKPEERSSSMVLITGPSRTADIEQILIRGVHGPGEIYVVLV